MTPARCNYVQVVRFVRRFNGRSQPVLVEGIDGNFYIMKFGNNPLGPNLSFNDAAGTELYRGCHLKVPRWERLYVSKSFLDRNRGSWLNSPEGPIRPDHGLCFGTRFILQGHGNVYEILPASYYAKIENRQSFWLAWILDVCCSSVDARKAIFLQLRAGLLDAVFIDSGGLFGGWKGEVEPDSWASTYRDIRIYPTLQEGELKTLLGLLHSIDTDKVIRRIRSLPLEWQTESAVARFERALELIHTPHRAEALVQHLFEKREAPLGNATRAREQDARRSIYLRPSHGC